jgi:thiol peroxidase
MATHGRIGPLARVAANARNAVARDGSHGISTNIVGATTTYGATAAKVPSDRLRTSSGGIGRNTVVLSVRKRMVWDPLHPGQRAIETADRLLRFGSIGQLLPEVFRQKAMKNPLSVFSAVVLLTACASPGTNQVQSDLPVDKGTAVAGAGHTVTMKGNALPLVGTGAVELGKPLPSAIVTSRDLKPVNLADSRGKARIISVVPSLDTPTCDKQTHELSEKNSGLDKDIELVTVSMDLPFAQSRFAKEAKIANVTFLSDYKSREFGNNNGLLIGPLGLLARAVIVTDKNNVVRYFQVVPELTALPDMPAAMQAAQALR